MERKIGSVKKPLRTFVVCTGPVVVMGQERSDLLVEPREHIIRGNEVKGSMVADVGYFQIVNSAGTVVFSAPAHSVLWSRVVEESVNPLALVKLFDEEDLDETVEVP